MIAFVSEFVQRLYYRFVVSPEQTLDGFISNSLSCFDIRDFPASTTPNFNFYSSFKNNSCGFGKPMCRYLWYLIKLKLEKLLKCPCLNNLVVNSTQELLALFVLPPYDIPQQYFTLTSILISQSSKVLMVSLHSTNISRNADDIPKTL